MQSIVVIDEDGKEYPLKTLAGWRTIEEAAVFAQIFFDLKKKWKSETKRKIDFDTLLHEPYFRRQLLAALPRKMSNYMGDPFAVIASGQDVRKNKPNKDTLTYAENADIGGFDVGDVRTKK